MATKNTKMGKMPFLHPFSFCVFLWPISALPLFVIFVFFVASPFVSL